jgi:hypothetical protein
MAGKRVSAATDQTGDAAGSAARAVTAKTKAKITAKIAALGDWRGAMLASIRSLIRQADPAVVEAMKWRRPADPLGVPVWSLGGILCTGETDEAKVKLTFAPGASLPDPSGLFDAGRAGGSASPRKPNC